MAEIVGFRPEHRDGFGDLVRATLAEFGFAEDPAMDGDLRDPAGAYAALWVVVDHGRVCGTAAVGVVEVKR